MRWAAIDFETATRSRTSACALGVVIVEDGVEVESVHSLIRPPGNRYEPMNVRIHGITPERTEHAASFAEVWDEARQLIGDRPLVAHNAPFDIGVVRRCCETFGVDLVQARYHCTVRMSRAAFPSIGSWRLPSVAQYLGLPLDHHDALSDALACSRITRACIDERGEPGLEALAASLGSREAWLDESQRRASSRG